ncbi:MAG: DNA-3-methyladenine glycosylase [Candidatus Bathyarchaeia archaeon]|nr:DNA-3-methyladenine glycosylase [Candidatus Bathyarchaeota archaeon]
MKEALPREFYIRDPKIVAINLLGKILVRVLDSFYLSGMIVETEAYYGEDDPASRARGGMKKYNMPMWGEPGRAFIYGVHGNWLLNIVAHEPNGVGAVLIRALEPLEGIEVMAANRGTNNIRRLTNGPGRLTKALKIDRSMNYLDLTSRNSQLFITGGREIDPREIGWSHRIGVRVDLDEKLRFFIKGNEFVSREDSN